MMRLPVPQAIIDAPSLAPGLEIYYDAFVELLSCRNMQGSIPWTAIEEYRVASGLDSESNLLFLVRRMDAAYLKWKEAHGKPQGILQGDEDAGQKSG